MIERVAPSSADLRLAEEREHPVGRQRVSRLGLTALVILLAVGKGAAYASLLHHPAEVLVLCGVVGAFAFLGGRLIATACVGAVIVPVAISPGSTGIGVAVGLGALVAIMALFIAIATLLHLSDARRSARARHTRRR